MYYNTDTLFTSTSPSLGKILHAKKSIEFALVFMNENTGREFFIALHEMTIFPISDIWAGHLKPFGFSVQSTVFFFAHICIRFTIIDIDDQFNKYSFLQ